MMLFKSSSKKTSVRLKSGVNSLDFLNLSYNQFILGLLEAFASIKEGSGTVETVVFSDYVQKTNSWKTWQQRILLITDKALYNIMPSDLSRCKRRIPIVSLSGMTLSQKSHEFILHVPSEYDYRMISKRKYEIMKIIQGLFQKCTKRNLNIELSSLKCLKSICVTKAKAKRIYSQNNKESNESISKAIQVMKNNTDIEDPLGSSSTETTEYFDTQSQDMNKETCLSPELFIPIKVLGRGSFGKVMLVRLINTTEYYAMKSLHKSSIVSRQQIKHTKEERKVLVSVNHPFLVKLHFAFQTETKLYFVMDYLRGGELFHHLKKQGRFSHNRAMLYTAEILLGIGHLHKNNIIYRDLKPENVLLDEYGHICLTDFGLSKITSSRTNTFCGTPEYLAPEIISGKGHDKSVDWWSLGILLFEMLVGIPPFYSEDSSLLYERIKQQKLKIPEYVRPSASDIISQLLKRDATARLGNGKLDYKALMTRTFFSGIDWNHVINKRYIPEFVPERTYITDTSNFDEEFTSEPVVDSFIPDNGLGTSLLDGNTQPIKFSQFTFNADCTLK